MEDMKNSDGKQEGVACWARLSPPAGRGHIAGSLTCTCAGFNPLPTAQRGEVSALHELGFDGIQRSPSRGNICDSGIECGRGEKREGGRQSVSHLSLRPLPRTLICGRSSEREEVLTSQRAVRLCAFRLAGSVALKPSHH
ncbi:hypothetical protein COCON_G00124030 [Conger conger]|uniref:Uncharacterized protein n=1 Tax=Conger conger TaxID=82655 RepID=A0A9Q1DHR4_CONCO|nr:hypothetical protein COCON_G00124030 [Conger conger]